MCECVLNAGARVSVCTGERRFLKAMVLIGLGHMAKRFTKAYSWAMKKHDKGDSGHYLVGNNKDDFPMIGEEPDDSEDDSASFFADMGGRGYGAGGGAAAQKKRKR